MTQPYIRIRVYNNVMNLVFLLSTVALFVCAVGARGSNIGKHHGCHIRSHIVARLYIEGASLLYLAAIHYP